MPDLVGALGISQGWGSAQISGELHQVYPDIANNDPFGGEDNIGWAVGAGVNINLPFANSGSNVYFQAFYADGALSYIGNGITGLSINDVDIVSDYYGDDTNTGYSLSAGAYIQATPTVGLALDGSYAHTDQTAYEIDRWAIDGSVQWEPVSGFVLAADAGYSNASIEDEDVDWLLFGVRMQRTF